MNKREFKFRVWCADYGYLHKIDINSDVTFADGKWFYSGGNELSDRDVIQQYTGLKDKNGVEIYEGDIIRGMMEFGPAGFHERSVIVKWDNKEGYQWNYFLLDTIKVEGNMFENPELLDLI